MKKISQILLISTFCSLSFSVTAQQSPTFGFTPYLLSVSNPAMTKSITPVNISLAGRKYWVGVPNSPEAFIGTFSLSQAEYKSAVGGYFWRENAPMISKQTIGVNYAYAVKNMDAGNNLRLGMGMDFISVSMNNSSILTYDYNDPFYTALVNNNKSSVDLRLGAVLNLSNFEVGLAMQQVLKSKNAIGEIVNQDLSFENSFVTNGHLKYNIKYGENTVFSPMVFWQTQKSVPTRVDINLLAEKTGKVWGGVWIRPKAAAGVMAGLWIAPEVKLGYLYERAFFKGITRVGNSHELMISYSPNFTGKKSSLPETEKAELVVAPAPQVIRVIDTLVIVKEIRITETAPERDPVVTPKREEPVREKPAVREKEPVEVVTTGNFYVITGLFGVIENATNLGKKLRADGYIPMLVKNKPKEQWYVAVGKFNSEEEAKQFIATHPNPNYTFWVKEIKD